MKRILIPLPDKDFDLTEVAVPWKRLKEKGYIVEFATENGALAQTDPLLISGVIFGQLGAKKEAIQWYRLLEKSPEFLHPIKFKNIDVEAYDLLHLPGGHAQGMKQYLENKVLQDKVVAFFRQDKIIGAICHGGVVLARSIDPATNKSVIHTRTLTALTKILERTAYWLTAWKLGKYYRTYPAYVQDEIVETLAKKEQFITGNPFKPLVIEDGNLITARYPDDAYQYAQKLIDKLESKH